MLIKLNNLILLNHKHTGVNKMNQNHSYILLTIYLINVGINSFFIRMFTQIAKKASWSIKYSI